jgi:hypothetical protein
MDEYEKYVMANPDLFEVQVCFSESRGEKIDVCVIGNFPFKLGFQRNYCNQHNLTEDTSLTFDHYIRLYNIRRFHIRVFDNVLSNKKLTKLFFDKLACLQPTSIDRVTLYLSNLNRDACTLLERLRGYPVQKIMINAGVVNNPLSLEDVEQLTHHRGIKRLEFNNRTLDEESVREYVIRSIPTHWPELETFIGHFGPKYPYKSGELLYSTIPFCFRIKHVEMRSDFPQVELDAQVKRYSSWNVRMAVTLVSAIEIPRLREEGRTYLPKDCIRAMFATYFSSQL